MLKQFCFLYIKVASAIPKCKQSDLVIILARSAREVVCLLEIFHIDMHLVILLHFCLFKSASVISIRFVIMFHNVMILWKYIFHITQ